MAVAVPNVNDITNSLNDTNLNTADLHHQVQQSIDAIDSGDLATSLSTHGSSNITGIISEISDNYNFIKQVSEDQITITNASDMLTIQKKLQTFAVDTQLVSKVASVTITGVNSLVKMQ